MAEKQIDEATGTETTGHEWDGIQELNTPLPRWWLQIFYATVVFSVIYVIAYPAIPLINSATKGVLGHSTRGDVAAEIAEHQASQAQYVDAIAAADFETIRADANLLNFATKAGASAFSVNCSQCHGSGAQGAPGYPNLNDDAWIWGGGVDEIYHTIKHGVRNADSDDARIAEMPAFGADEILSKPEIADTTQYVLSLSGLDHDAEAAARGAEAFADNCAACHGDAGEGIQEVGAPRLNDAIWLFGGTAAQVSAQISRPAHGVMPAWGLRLDDATVKSLAIYVHNLGGGT